MMANETMTLCQELKTEAGTKFLADYMRSLCHSGLCHEFNHVIFDISNKERINFVLADTNIPSSSKVSSPALSHPHSHSLTSG